MEPDEPKLSKTEERILRGLATGDAIPAALDWVAVQHLKQKGLVEDSPTGPKITDAGRRAIGGARP